MKTRLVSLSVVLAGLAAAPAAVAETYALVIGVSDYLVLDADLRGPANDTGLVTQMLVDRGVAPGHIRLLASDGSRHADGVAIHAVPTRAAIMDGLAHLVQVAQAGDTVFFYYSGHGSQAPDQNGDEAGGYDEILLPADASGWKGAIGAVENAIVDDELAVSFQAILDSGAQMVAVLDACHSATGFRAIGSQASAARYVDPVALGIPQDTPGQDGGAVSAPLRGEYAFLYSSQSNQRSFEYPLGDAADPGNWYGDFTRALMGVLSAQPNLRWEQALRAATDGMSRNGPAAQSPDGEGTLMTAGVFGTAAPEQRFATAGDSLSAGILHGLAEGAQVAIYETLTAQDPVATATVTALKANSASLRADMDLPQAGYAVVTLPGLPNPLRLAAPLRADAMDGRDYAPLQALLATLAQADALEGVRLNATDYDMQPYLVDGTLALAGRDGVLDPHGPGSSPRLSLAGAEYPAVALSDFLERAARASRLRAALAGVEGGGAGGFSLFGNDSGISQSLSRVAGTVAGDECAEVAADPQGAGDPVTTTHCDQLWLTLRNTDLTAQDVTVLYVDRDYNVSAIWPEPGISNRIAFGEEQEVGMLIQNPPGPAGRTRAGVEEIVVISAPAQDGAPRTELTALADPVLTRDLSASGGALQAWLGAALTPDETSRTLSLPGSDGLPALSVKRYTVILQGDG
ncbi:caspase family protein [Thalassovita sp.]|uniref:caspase family protein n=1 Tax=Thalassovita sp. TaxID=1979401 RepID=UPI0029DE868A|nr:caspase family protein [Thalassovita sp.]